MFDLYLALGGFSDLVNNTQVNQEAINRAWDTNWQILILPKNNLIFQNLDYAARVIGASCFVYSFIQALSYFSQTYDPSNFMFLLRPILIFTMIANGGTHAADTAYGLHHIMDTGLTTFLTQEVNGVKIKQVIYDPIATASAKHELVDELNKCGEEPMVSAPASPDTGNTHQETQPECLKKLEEQAKQLQTSYEQKYCWGFCPGVARFFKEVGDDIEKALNKYSVPGADDSAQQEAIAGAGVVTGIADKLTASAEEFATEQKIYATSWAFTNGMEGGECLSGLIFPLVLALSLMPEKRQLVFDWFVIFCSFGLALFYYDVIVGLTALLILNSQSESATTLQYAMMLGFGASSIALGLATGGAFVAIKAAYQSYSQQIGTVTSIATSTISLAALLL